MSAARTTAAFRADKQGIKKIPTIATPAPSLSPKRFLKMAKKIPAMMAMLKPEMAMMCAVPVFLNAFCSSFVMPVSTPSKIPASSKASGS